MFEIKSYFINEVQMKSALNKVLTSNWGRPRAVNLIAVIPVPNVAPDLKNNIKY